MDGDGKDEVIHVGPDTIPGTEDDYWTFLIRFDANGGRVNNKAVYSTDVSKVTSLPTATSENYNFRGWYTAPTGGSSVSLYRIQNITENTIVYAHWATIPTGGGNIGGGTVDIGDNQTPLATGSVGLTEDHIAYVSGYTDGTVRPEAISLALKSL